MPESLLGALYEIGTHAVKLGMEHVARQKKRRDDQEDERWRKSLELQPLKPLAELPRFQPAPLPLTLPALAAPKERKSDQDAGSASSYAEEFAMDDSSPVACWPCTRRHLNTCLVAAEEGAKAATAEERKAAAATVVGESAVWERYDITPEKLVNTSPERRRAVEAAVPGMKAAAGALPAPPGNLALAWSAAVEAYRFANSRGGNPSPMERREADLRMEDVQGWVGYLDTLPLLPDAAPHLDALRRARHRLNRDGNTPEAIAQMRDALRAAAVALTPDPGREALERAAGRLRDARTAFYGGALGAMRGTRSADRAPSALAGRTAFEDVETRIPVRYVAQLKETPAETPFLGATPETRVAFENLVRFDERRGVPVRDYPIPPEGDPREPVVVFGAYIPGEGPRGTILLGPQALAEAPHDVETLGEETAHSLLAWGPNYVWDRRQTQKLPYEEQPEEREAKLANLLALLSAGVPFETETGQRVDPRAVSLDAARLEAVEDPRIVRRAKWAGGIIGRAMRGDVDGALAEAEGRAPR